MTARVVEPARRGWRRLAAALTVGACVGALLGAPPVHADPAGEEIYRQLGVSDVAADYVVLVDVSGSLRTGNQYAALKTGLRGLFAALAPIDQVTVVTFADRAVQVWQQPAGESPDAIVAKLPPVADGKHTDIGLALEKAVQVLQRPNAPGIGTVILLTDGKHDPKPGSRYPLESGYAWDQLTKSAAGLRKEALSAYAIPLAGDTGAPLLKKVFGSRTSILPATNVDRIGDRLAQPKQRVRVAKAQGLLAADLDRAVAVQWPSAVGRLGSSSTFDVTLRSDNAHLPLSVDGLAVGTTCGDRVRAQVETAAVQLPPGGSAPVRVTVDWDAGDASWKPSQTVRQECGLQLTGRVGTPWAGFLDTELRVAAAPSLAGAEATGSFSAQRGSPGWWSTGALALLLLLAAALVLRWQRLHPAMNGVLTATPVAASGEPAAASGPAGGSVALRGRRMMLSAANLGINGSGSARGLRSRVRSARTDLEIVYSRDGSVAAREVGVCPPEGSTTVSGTRFEWRTGGR